MTPEPAIRTDETHLVTRAPLDGNAAAGEFAAVLGFDPTTVTVRCDTCSSTRAFGELNAYLRGPGTVLRCPDCGSMVARVARTAQGAWLDLSGSSSWLIPQPRT